MDRATCAPNRSPPSGMISLSVRLCPSAAFFLLCSVKGRWGSFGSTRVCIFDMLNEGHDQSCSLARMILTSTLSGLGPTSSHTTHVAERGPHDGFLHVCLMLSSSPIRQREDLRPGTRLRPHR